MVVFSQRVNLEVKVGNKRRKETVKTAARTPPVTVRVEASQKQKTKGRPRGTPKPKEEGKLFSSKNVPWHFTPG